MSADIKKGKVHKELTVERLREFPGFQAVSDEEAREIITSLEKLSLILFSHIQNIKRQRYEKQSDSNIRKRKDKPG